MDTPTSPPAGPVIPVGLATKLGVVFSVLAAVAAAVLGVLEGDQTPETITLLVAALGAAYKVMDGRYNQATAAVGTDPEVLPDEDDDLDFDVPSEEELKGQFIEDAPVDDAPEGAVSGKAGEIDSLDDATGQGRR